MSYEPEDLGFYKEPEVIKLVEILTRELGRISVGFGTVDKVVFEELNAEPAKPRTGLTVLADGTNWDPGSGQGVYTYYNGTWNKLG